MVNNFTPTGVGGQYWSDGGVQNHSVRVGSLYGARSFSLTEEGYLTGVTFHEPWQPGPNTATCWKRTGYGGIRGGGYPMEVMVPETMPDREPYPDTIRQFVWDPMRKNRAYRRDMETDPAETNFEPMRLMWAVTEKGGKATFFEEKPTEDYGNSAMLGHTPAGCQCGYHGYLRGSMDFAQYTDRVSAVVKAWGTLVLGEVGFRSQFAEVVALYVPPATGDRAGEFTVRPQQRRWQWQKGAELTPVVLAAVRARYPVPFFTSLDAMLAEFPTTPPTRKEAD